MNEILQKRIDEAAKRYAWSHDTIGVDKETFHTEASQKHPIPIDKHVRVPIQHEMEVAFKCAAHFILNNQWISVDEALPKKDEDGSDTSIYVLITDSTNPFGYIWKAYFDFTIKDWYDAMSCENLAKLNITHWMPIPQIGGEK